MWSLTHLLMGGRVVICGALKSVGPGTRVKETFWGDGNVSYLDLGDSYISVYICQNSSNCTLKICACKLFFNKVLLALKNKGSQSMFFSSELKGVTIV